MITDIRTPTRLAARRPAPGPIEDRWPLVAAGGVGAVVAVSLASGHLVVAAVGAIVPMVCVLAAGGLSRVSRASAKTRMVGVVWLLLASSTLVWRVRTTQELDSDPLDSAALVRVGLVAGATLLALVFLLATEVVPRRVPTPIRFLGAYIVVAALSAVGSPLPRQALYRAFELGAGFLALFVAFILIGDRAGPVILRLLITTIGVIVTVIWVEALLLPARAWLPSGSILPYELHGVLPLYSSNTVGALGALLGLWGLARTNRGRRGILVSDLALVTGVATLVASQYRTGVVGFLLGGAVVAWRRRRRLFVVLSALAVLAVLFVGIGEFRAHTQTVFAKGHPELVSSLDSRTLYWRASVPLIRERPLLGWGLNVGSRRVLVSLGYDSTSTIHGTWVEALLGTGIVGTSLLAAAFLVALRHAWRAQRRHPAGAAIAGMIVFLLVRSLTGSTAELFDILFLAFGALALAAAQRQKEVWDR